MTATPSAQALEVTPFTQTADMLVHGDYTVTGNGVLTCSGSSCAALLSGTGSSNDGNTMVYTGAGNGMLNSSSATITIPAGAKVVRAKLMWAGSMGTSSPLTTFNNSGVYNTPTTQNSCSPSQAVSQDFWGRFYYNGPYYPVKTMPAGSPATTQPVLLVNGKQTSVPIGSYRTDRGLTQQGNSDYYAASGDVLSALQALPTGSPQKITVGNIWAPEGNNCMGGWSLQVVYDYGAYVPGNKASVLREIYSYDGYVREFDNDPPTSIVLSGLKVQGTGARAAFTAYEGDKGLTGDNVEYSDPTTSRYKLPNPQTGTNNNMFVGYADGAVPYPVVGGSAPAGTFYNASVDARSVDLPGLASGDDSLNLVLGTDQDSYLLQNVTISVPMAEITILKTAGNGEQDQAIQPGDTPNFRITIYNSGAVPLLNMRVVDESTPACGKTAAELAVIVNAQYPNGQIPPGASVQYTCKGTATTTSYDNTAAVTGQTPNGLVVNNSGVAKVLVGRWAVTKTNKTPDVPKGSTATWTITVANTGEADIYGVNVVDTGFPSCNKTVPLVQAGQRLVYECQGIVSDSTTNSISATGTAKATENATITVPLTATAATTDPVYVSAIDVTKTANKQIANVNEDVTFTFVVKNTGTSTLNTVSLTDPEFPSCNQANVGPLAAGASRTVTCTVKVFTAAAQNALTNHVTAVGTPPSGLTVTDADQVTVNNKSLKLAKTAATTDTNGNGVLDAGDTVRYSFVVTNTGSGTLTNVTVADPRLAGVAITCTPTTLATNATATCTAAAPYTVKQSDVDAATLVNTATATGTASDGSTTSGTASVTLTPVQQPALAMTKTASPATVTAVGQQVTYTYSVRNSGNTSLSGVNATDPMAGLSARTCTVNGAAVTPPTTLAPGQVLTCTATRTTTQADLDAGTVVNTATATGTSPKGTVVNASAQATVTATQRPAITFDKSADATTVSAVGQVVTYTFSTTNTGNVTLSGVQMSDPNPRLADRKCLTPQPATLAPGQTLTCSGTITVTQADLDGGSILNSATASANPPSGASLRASDTWVIAPAASPGIALAKAANRDSVTAAGQQVTYTLTATNQGNTTLGNVTVTDPMPGLTIGTCSPAAPATLAPGARMTCTATYTSTQADVDRGSITNTATTNATDSHGTAVSATASRTVTATPAPAIQLTKSANPAQVTAAGQSVTYTFTLRNSGNVTLSNLALDDPIAGLSAPSCTPTALGASLAPGASTTCTATRTVTQTEVNAGRVSNTATARGTSPGGVPATSTSTATVTATQTPAYTLTKTASPTQVDAAGQRVTYSIVVTNTGNVTLSSLRVSDPKVASLACTPVAQGASLAPGATTTCTGTYLATQNDVNAGTINNTASALLTPPTGADLARTASAVVTTRQSPSLSTTKTASTTTYARAGEVIGYTITSRNTGNVTLTNVTVSDPMFPSTAPLACTPASGATLNPGETITCTGNHTVTQAEVDAGTLANTATGRGQGPGGTPATSTATATATATQAPAFTLAKTPSPASIATVGRAITYTIVLTNTGNVSLSSATISDPMLPTFTSCTPAQGSRLAPGATMTCTGTYTSTQADVDAGSILNTASATATPPTGPALSRTAPAVVAVEQNPVLTLAKSASPNRVSTVGQAVTYSFLVTNTGNVTASALAINDPLPGLSPVSCPVATLRPGASTTCTATRATTQADLNLASGSLTNTATTSATDPSGKAFPAATGRATVTMVQTPRLAVTKTATPTTVSAVGQRVGYTIAVSNTGNVDVANVRVSDNLIPSEQVSCTPAAGSTLAPGATMTCTATRTTTQADLDAGRVVNTATASGAEPNGSAVPVASAQATVTAEQTPTITIDKQASRTSVQAVGDQIDYTYVVTNTGNVSVGSIKVSDPHPGLTAISCPATTSLLPGAQLTCTAHYSTTQADLNAGSVPDTATVRAEPPRGDPNSTADDVVASDSVVVTATQAPALLVTKTANQTTYAAAGRTITYTVGVQNTGNVDIANMRVTDPMTGLSPLACTPAQGSTLAPQGTMTCTGTYTVTQADIDNRTLVNTATAAGTAPDGSTVQRSATRTLTATITPAMTFSKAADPTTVTTLGQLVTYTFTATNTGNATMRNLTVTDPMEGLSAVTCQATSLAPQASTTCSATYRATQADLDRGRIQNTATMTATDPSGAALSRNATTTVQATQTATLSIDKKTTSTSVRAVGDVIDYTFTVTNTGNVTASQVTVADPLPGLSAISCPATTLAPGAAMDCTASYRVTQANLDSGQVQNTATVRGTSPTGVAITPATDRVSVPVEQDARRTFTKTATPATVSRVGEVVTYTFEVHNTGNVTIGNVLVDDPMYAVGMSTQSCYVYKPDGVTVDHACAGAISLAPGEWKRRVATYTVTQADLDAGSIPNTATLGSTAPGGAALPRLSSSFLVDADQRADMTLAKTADTSTYSAVGQVVTYSFLLTNTGNVSITNARIADPMPGLSEPTCTPALGGTLAPRATMRCSATHTVTQADLDARTLVNTATATGTGSDGTQLSREASLTVRATLTPAIQVAKSGAPGTVREAGETVTYSFVVRNTGNATLSNLAVADPMPGLSPVSCPVTTLAPGAQTTCTATHRVTQAELDAGSIQNVATASATDPAGTSVSQRANAVVQVAQAPRLAVAKSSSVDRVDAVGDVVDYTFTVTNTGNTTVNDIVLDDPLLDPRVVSCPQASLAPGAGTTCRASHTVTQDDLDAGSIPNTATATGTTTTGVQVPPASGSDVVQADQNPSWTFTKTASRPRVARIGETVTYTMVATNTGNVTIGNAVVSDPSLGRLSCSVTDAQGAQVSVADGPVNLEPGQRLVCTGTRTFTQADFETPDPQPATPGIDVVNTARAAGQLPNGTALPDQTATATVALDPAPDFTMAKFADSQSYSHVGQQIQYTVTATNSGNVALNDVQIRDTKLAGVALDCTPAMGSTLQPGQMISCVGTYTVTQADVNAGSITNQAAGVGTDNQGVEHPATAAAVLTVEYVGATGMDVSKSANPSAVSRAGQQVTYTFTVTNLGESELLDVQLEDPMPGLSAISCPASSVAATTDPTSPTTMRCTATYTVTQADIDRQGFSNTVSASATSAGQQLTDTATARVLASHQPALTLGKTGVAADGALDRVGDVVDYTFVVTNTGNVALGQLAVSDALPGISDVSCPTTSLAPLASTTCTASYTLTQSDLNQKTLVNRATATAVDLDGEPASATAGNTLATTWKPSLVLDKSASRDTFDKVGDVVTYTFRATNTGNVVLNNVVVSDPMSGLSRLTCQPATGPISLQPGATKTCTATRTITQADIDAGSLVNTATVSSVLPDGSAGPTGTDSTTVTAEQTGAIEVTKQVDQLQYNQVGQRLNYSFVISNTGNVSIADVRLIDSLPVTDVVCTPGLGSTLAGGAQMSCRASYTVTQADLDALSVVNTATATGATSVGSVTDTSEPVTSTAVLTSGIDLVKTANVETVTAAGQKITYTFAVTNTGTGTLSGVGIVDDKPGLSAIDCGQWDQALAPGATQRCTATYTVTQDDIDQARPLEQVGVGNTATATGRDANKAVVSDEDSTMIQVQHQPSITLDKSATPATVSAVDEKIAYSFVLTNTGNVALTNIALGDPVVKDLSCPATTLAQGSSMTCTASLTVEQHHLDQGSIPNTATVHADDVDQSISTAAQDSFTVGVTQKPKLTLAKQVSPTTITSVGETMTYTFVARNEGNTTLSNVFIADQIDGLSALSCGDLTGPVSLYPGQVKTCTATRAVTQADIDTGSVDNTATVTAGSPTGALSTSASALAEATQQPRLEVTKTVDKTEYGQLGETLGYGFTIRNTGNTSVADVRLADSIDVTDMACTPTLGSTLASGQTMTCSARHGVTQADLDARSVANTATATGTAPGAVAVSDESNTVVSTAVLKPAITLTKQGAPGTVSRAGETITYTYVVQNTGNATLDDVVVTDDKPGVSALTCDRAQPLQLQPGAQVECTATYRVTQADIDGAEPKLGKGIDNTATVQGRDAAGTAATAEATSTVQVNHLPALDLAKTSSVDTVDAVGDTVTYTFRVTNTGAVTMRDLVLDDPMRGLGPITCDKDLAALLAPGQSVTCTATRVVDQSVLDAGVVVNTATVTGSDIDHSKTATDQDSARVTAVQDPVMTLAKSSDVTTVKAVGDPVTYTFTMANAGNVTLTNVYIADPLPGLSAMACTITAVDGTTRVGNGPVSVAPGETKTCRATRPTTQTDLDAGSITNTASVSASSPAGAMTPVPSNPVVVTASQAPGIALVKTVQPTRVAAAGDTVTYTLEATNTGTVTLDDVRISDTMQGLTNFRCDAPRPEAPAMLGDALGVRLAPGETVHCQVDKVVTAAEMDLPRLENTATVSAQAPTTPVTRVSSQSSATLIPVHTPKLALTKGHDVQAVNEAGQVVTFTFTVTNSGNVRVAGIAIAEEMAGVSTPACERTTLEPGEATTCTATYRATQADVDRGSITNSAQVTGTDPVGGDAVQPGTATDTVEVSQKGSLSTEKTARTTTPVAVGDPALFDVVVTNTGNTTLREVAVDDDNPSLASMECTPGQPAVLAPGASMRCTATVTTLQSDVDAGRVANRASARGVMPDQSEVTSGFADAQVPTMKGSASATFAKTADVASVAAPGDVVNYTFTTTNTGTLSLLSPQVSDQLKGLGPVSCDLDPGDPLPPRATMTCRAAYTVTQQDLDAGLIRNAARLYAEVPQGGTPITLTDSVDVEATQRPVLELSKTGSTSTITRKGDTVTYTFAVANGGNVGISLLGITDQLAGLGELRCTDPAGATLELPALLEPRERATCQADYVATQADVDAGSLLNSAVANGRTALGRAVDSTVSGTVVTAPQDPSVSLTKVADTTLAQKVGQQVRYTMTATNTGNVSLSGATITDPMALSDYTCTPGAGSTLAPDEVMTCQGTHSVTHEDLEKGGINNTAAFTATDPTRGDVRAEASTTVPALYDPRMEFSKTVAAPAGWKAGDRLTYTFHVRNAGNMDAYHVLARDTMADLSATTCTVDGTGTVVEQDLDQPFPPGLSVTCTATYTVKQSDVDRGFVTNTARLTAREATGQPFPEVSDTATTTTVQSPSMSVEKSADAAQFARAGQPVLYSFDVTNTGNVTLSGFQVTDRLPGLSPLSCDATAIAPGAVMHCTASYTTTQADMDDGTLSNHVDVTARGPFGSAVAPVSDDFTMTAVTHPALSLDKSSRTSQVSRAGEVVQFSLTATNTGDVTAHGVTIEDKGVTFTGCDQPMPAILPPGDTLTCTVDRVVTQDDVNRGSFTNTATVDGLDPQDRAIERATASRTVTSLRDPSIQLTKRVDKATYTTLGETLTYTMEATNTGNTTLFGATISDPLPGLSALDCTPAAPATLQPGQALTCTATRAVTQADLDGGRVDNLATVRSETLGGDPASTADDVTATADARSTSISKPSLSLVKSADRTSVSSLNDVITYSFLVTNTGNTTLRGVLVSDPLTGQGMTPIACPRTTLAPREEMTCTASFRPAQIDLDRGHVPNTATVTGTDPFGTPAEPGKGSTTVDVDQKPDYSLTKSADHVLVSEVGEKVLYTFIGTNTGNVTLHVVQVTDPMEGLVKVNEDGTASDEPGLSCYPNLPAELPPGERVVCRAWYLVTQDDLDAGALNNTATITGEDPLGRPLDPETAQEVIQTVPSERNIELTKSAVVTDASAPQDGPGNTLTADEAGDVVDYTFTLVNTGNQTATDVTLTDEMFPDMAGVVCGPDRLPGSSRFTLGPEEGLQCTASHTVTQADLDGTSNERRLAGIVRDEADDPVYDGDVLQRAGTDPRQEAEPGIFNTAVMSATLPPVRDPDTGTMGEPRRVHSFSQVAVPVEHRPSFTVSKVADVEEVRQVGDPVTYTFTITNTGNVSLRGLALDDPMEGLGELSCTDLAATELAPGQSVVCTAGYSTTQADLDRGVVDNQVTARASAVPTTPGTDEAPVPDLPLPEQEASSTVRAAQAPQVTFTKTRDTTGAVKPGAEVTYTFQMANTGNVATTIVQLVDIMPGLGQVSCEQELPVRLAPGATNTCTASYVVQREDADKGTVNNSAELRVVSPQGSRVAVPPASAVVPIEPSPSVQLTKTADLRDTNGDGIGQAGEQVAYTITAANTGDVTLRDALVSDPMLGAGLACSPGQGEPLAPGAVRTCTGVHTITEAQAAAGELVNTASFSAPALCTRPMPDGRLAAQAVDPACAPVQASARVSTSVIPQPTPPAPSTPGTTRPTPGPQPSSVPQRPMPEAPAPPVAHRPEVIPQDDAVLADTGAPVRPWMPALGLAMTIAGALLLVRKKKENQ